VSFRKSVYEELERFQYQHKEFDLSMCVNILVIMGLCSYENLEWQKGEELVYELQRKLMKE